MKKPLIIIEGPTAVGKSDVAVLVARKMNTEIISADSVQVYRGMDIGSGKITKDEMQGVPHHLIDIFDPADDYDITRFVESSKAAIDDITSRGMIPIVAGGTGFYLQAMLCDIDFSEGDPDTSYRKELEKMVREKGPEYLHDMLKEVDPEAAEAIHPNNVKRTVRALEYFKTTGRKISDKNAEDKEKESAYDALIFFLDTERETLYRRIELRVDKMLEMGLVDEVRRLKEAGLSKNNISMLALGYKEILDYLDGITDFDQAVSILKQSTRRFAKRQLSWFNHHPHHYHLMREDYPDNQALANEIYSHIQDYFEI